MRVAIRRDPQGLFPNHNAGRSPNAPFSVACDLPQPFVVLGLRGLGSGAAELLHCINNFRFTHQIGLQPFFSVYSSF
jgi:hypothetical protein